MSKQLTPMQELIDKFKPIVSKIGLLTNIENQCARICLSEMEREAVGFADWKIENYQLWPGRGYYSKFNDGSYGKSHITHTFYTTAQLYQLYKQLYKDSK